MSGPEAPDTFVLEAKHELKIPGKPRSVWLVKIPSSDLAHAIETAVDNEEIGILKRDKRIPIPTDGPVSKRLKYKVEIDSNFSRRADEKHKHPTPMRRHYNLQFHDNVPEASVFSEATDSKGKVTSLAYESIIGAEAMMMQDHRDFSAITARFNAKTKLANFRTSAQETKEQNYAYNPRSKEAIESSRRLKDRKEKRTRDNVTDDQIKERIFDLFKDYEYIRLKDIVNKLNLPEGPVRRVLITLADPVKEVEHRNTWRLKERFRLN